MQNTLHRASYQQSSCRVLLRAQARPTHLTNANRQQIPAVTTFPTKSEQRRAHSVTCVSCWSSARSQHGSSRRHATTLIRPNANGGNPPLPNRRLSTTRRLQERESNEVDLHSSLNAEMADFEVDGDAQMAAKAKADANVQKAAEAEATVNTQAAELELDDFESWARLFRFMQASHGDDGVWACFELLRDKHQVLMLMKDSGTELRNIIVGAAATQDKRVDILLGVATRLRTFQQDWPDLYGATMASLIRNADYKLAIDCHHRLSASLHPGPDAIAGLLSVFVLDSSEELQSCLRTIYNFSPWRNLYDRIIPMIYEAGLSALARDWRRVFLKEHDRETSSNCRPFLEHLVVFYPLVNLTEQEQQCLLEPPPEKAPVKTVSNEKSVRTTFRDGFIAKTFASGWLSLDFAINTVQRLGLTTIGPRALQALALREGNAKQLVARLAQIERLDLEISNQVYCKALVFFARNGEEELLRQLLACGIHPDEFDNEGTRQQMLGQGDLKTLLDGVDWAMENETSQLYLNRLLRNVLGTRHLGKAMLVVARMNALKINITQQNMNLLLARGFKWVGTHPRPAKKSNLDPKWLHNHNRAVIIMRNLLPHDVGIPIDYWHFIFNILGRLGRFEELLQLALELVRRYKPERGGLVPMHPSDRPSNIKSKPKKEKLLPGDSDDNTYADKMREFAPMGKDAFEEPYWIPSDLPLSHRQHPINRIFESKLQRSIIRWGYDKTLLTFPARKIADTTKLGDYDVALGVRILKVLKDNGVLINKDVVRSGLAQRTGLAHLAERRHRARDSDEIEAANIKRLVDEAWPDLLGSLKKFEGSVDDARRSAWRRGSHDRAFQRHYDQLTVLNSVPGPALPPVSGWGEPAGKENDEFWRRQMADGSYLDLEYGYPRPDGALEATSDLCDGDEDEELPENVEPSEELQDKFTRKWRGPQW